MIITTTKEMRPRDEHDFYPTPLGHCRSALELLPDSFTPAYVLDPGAGAGPWGTAARERWPHTHITGAELRRVPRPEAYDRWECVDYCVDGHYYRDYDLVIGNPPYKYAEAFVRHGLAGLRPGGYLLFLLRLAFLESQTRGRGLWREHPPQRVAVCVKRPSFTGDGNTDATAYACFLWQQGWRGTPALGWVDTSLQLSLLEAI